MTQVIEFRGQVPVPEGSTLIDSDELKQLREQATIGRAWTMSDLRNWLGNKSSDWINHNIINNPRYYKEIQMMRNHNEITGGGRGSNYLFRASTMAAFIERHWSELPW